MLVWVMVSVSSSPDEQLVKSAQSQTSLKSLTARVSVTFFAPRLVLFQLTQVVLVVGPVSSAQIA